ncbi:MAG: 16S rRNA (cytidine(1402)-2'-O)-methyltransferase [Thermodesulfobacteriota bacterium]
MALSGLYIVACPIGNYEDITLRALKILREADVIASEDTRETGRLLLFHGIEAGGRLVSCHEHNERRRLEELTGRLSRGESVALVSDAGTPTVSDPGYNLVRHAVEKGIAVVPVPGVSAVTCALAAGGLPTDAFFFEGFLPKKKGKRESRLTVLAELAATLIFFESPQRIVDTLRELIAVLGDRDAVLCREMTKPYEEFLRGRLSAILQNLERRDAVKGEMTLLVAGNAGGKEELDSERLRRELEHASCGASELAAALSAKYGIPRRQIYERILRLKEEE